MAVLAGLSLAATRGCRWVRCVEISPNSQAAFREAYTALRRIQPGAKVEYIVAPAGSRPEEFLEGRLLW
jgi:hypothetical protein